LKVVLTVKAASPSVLEIEQFEPYKLLVAHKDHLSAEIARHEAICERVREENTTLVAERTKFKEDLIAEHKVPLDEANNQLLRIERDLTRVRGVRDELHLELQNRKAHEDDTLHSAREISEIADAREVRSFVFAELDANCGFGERNCEV
jgi:E3 ubiquitin-protein ligase BRE1